MNAKQASRLRPGDLIETKHGRARVMWTEHKWGHWHVTYSWDDPDGRGDRWAMSDHQRAHEVKLVAQEATR